MKVFTEVDLRCKTDVHPQGRGFGTAANGERWEFLR